MEAPASLEVSVVIVVLDGISTIERQLTALAEQVGAPTFEVIVCDNGSTDGTADLVRRWIREARLGEVPLRLVDAGDRPGIPYARNCGIRRSTGRVVAFCDADDEVTPGWVAALARAVGSGLVGGRLRAIEPDGVPRPEATSYGLSATPYLPFAGSGNLGVDRRTLGLVGGFDESLPRYGFEDVDFCWRAQEAGFPLTFAPDAVVTFHLSPPSTAIRKVLQLGAGRVLMARRYPLYDDRDYRLLPCLGRLAGATVGVARARGPHRKPAARYAVASLGNLVGWWRYVARGRSPRPLLLTAEQVWESTNPG